MIVFNITHDKKLTIESRYVGNKSVYTLISDVFVTRVCLKFVPP